MRPRIAGSFKLSKSCCPQTHGGRQTVSPVPPARYGYIGATSTRNAARHHFASPVIFGCPPGRPPSIDRRALHPCGRSQWPSMVESGIGFDRICVIDAAVGRWVRELDQLGVVVIHRRGSTRTRVRMRVFRAPSSAGHLRGWRAKARPAPCLSRTCAGGRADNDPNSAIRRAVVRLCNREIREVH